MEKMKENEVYTITVEADLTREEERRLRKALNLGHRGQAMWRVLYAVTVLVLLAALLVTSAMCGARASEEVGETAETEQVASKLEIPSAELLYAIEAMEKILPPQVSKETHACVFSEKANAWDVSLTDEELEALLEACDAGHIHPSIGLGLIQVESSFNPDAVNSRSGCYGYCQLNPAFFPAELSPVDNIRTGIGYLTEQLVRYDNLEAALTAYNAGYDTGSREYAEKVLAAAERWQ